MKTQTLALYALPWVLAGCAATAPPAPPTTAAEVATRWHAPLPHDGRLASLQQWWSQFDDPLLLRLIDTAQRASPTVARAAAGIADARAARTAGGAALLPSLDVTTSAARSRADLMAPAATAASASLQANWELDLFGANRAGVQAAEARLQASQAGWHDARVSVAAEVARNYIELRACEALAEQARLDAASRAQTSRLTQAAAAVGLRSRSATELAGAGAAQGMAAWVQQAAQCDLLVKALVALSTHDEPLLRRELAVKTAWLSQPAPPGVAAVPAQVLVQRPDIHAAGLEVAAAAADATRADAQRWPRVTLAGSIGTTRVASGGISTDGSVWSIGPVAITFPLFDGGVRRANAQAARARYESATTVYAARLRDAVREVEAALVTLDSTTRRSDSAQDAALGFERAFGSMLASYQAGAASLFELEDTRRSMVAAQSALIELQRERVVAWIALYRAVGGGWSPTDLTPDTPVARKSP